MKDMYIALMCISIFTFLYNVIKTVFMTEEWDRNTTDTVLMFMIIVLGFGFAAFNKWWLPTVLFVYSFMFCVVNVKIEDGFEIQKQRRLFDCKGQEPVKINLKKSWKVSYNLLEVFKAIREKNRV